MLKQSYLYLLIMPFCNSIHLIGKCPRNQHYQSPTPLIPPHIADHNRFEPGVDFGEI